MTHIEALVGLLWLAMIIVCGVIWSSQRARDASATIHRIINNHDRNEDR